MSALICPTVLAEDAHAYREQMARLEPFAQRVHIDFADGDFAARSVSIAQAYWPEQLVADFHIMYRKPVEQLETIMSLKPNLVIVHVEAEGDLRGMLLELQAAGIKAGVALLKESRPQDHADIIGLADHILLFSGDLGKFGGKADFAVLRKVADVRASNPTAELGWDGGVNPENVPLLVEGGIEVLNVGGFIQHADDPVAAYNTLNGLLA